MKLWITQYQNKVYLIYKLFKPNYILSLPNGIVADALKHSGLMSAPSPTLISLDFKVNLKVDFLRVSFEPVTCDV